MKDERTLANLAGEAVMIQNASNLSGVVHAWSRSIKRLRELLPEAGTEEINTHPINVLFADKLANLTGVDTSWGVSQFSAAYSYCVDITNR